MSGNRDIMENSMGYGGFEYIKDTEAHTAEDGKVYVALEIQEDAVFSQIITEKGSEITGNTFTGDTIYQGDSIPGRFKTVKLASGRVRAHKGV